MRSLIIGLVVFLAACNSSSSGLTQTQLDAAIQKAVAPLQSQIDALQTSNKTLTAGQAKLTLIGKVHGVSSDSLRLQGEPTVGAVNATSFGPCSDMGVLEGDTISPGNGALGASYQAFKNCTNNHAEYSVEDGSLKIANREYFTTIDCTGTVYEWEAGGQGYSRQVLNDGVVFISPTKGTQLWIEPNQSPQMIQSESAWVPGNGCSLDQDFQPMWVASPNDVSKSGFPGSVGEYQLTAP